MDSSIQEKKSVKIAVIGSGLAGLSAAYLLKKGTQDQENVDIDVHLFEKNCMIGMDAASISIKSDDDDVRIDVPMRSFMSGYYAHLIRLYKHLDIPVKPASFSYGWYSIESRHPINMPAQHVASYTDNRSYLTYSGSRTVGRLNATLRSSSSTLSTSPLKSSSSSSSTTTTTTSSLWSSSSSSISSSTSIKSSWNTWVYDLFMSWWIMLTVAFSYTWLMIITLWLHHRGHLRNEKHPIANMTLGQWFKHYHIHPYFAHQVFVPLFAAVCTNSWEAMLNYPATEVLEYMALGLFQESYVVTQGIRQVVDRLSEPLTDIHLGVQIQSIQPSKSSRKYILKDDQDKTYECDHIIFATQANQALTMLQTYYQHLEQQQKEEKDTSLVSLEAQISMLKQFSYDTSLVINHTDSRLLPSDRRHWRALNFARVDQSIQPDPMNDSRFIVPFPHDTTMTTHILNWTYSRLGDHTKQQSSSYLYLQTTNPCISPDPKHILSASWFERATVTLASKRAIESDLFPLKKGTKGEVSLGHCQGTNGIWFVGSYCWRGIPLLEGCVASAEKVVVDGIGRQENIQVKVPW
ncbi:uncharacterized protein BX664DRAFT_354728 [Halteromyces radiatus]|uniref:uncharacterized protein n=1 Tax=Halteromyces radiatus TaxID=101107 RepID=UPI00221F9B12|nr:uncharacterized protein BX664DRAFT_354728 [Halteromyces radiatus]KAI8099282.1 hypothetical protein BX664DRAFT_354728 [Halteromyces radiatus]